MWYDHSFSQRNKALKGALRVEVGNGNWTKNRGGYNIEGLGALHQLY